MTGNHSRWSSPRARLGLAAGALLAVGLYALLGQSSGQAEPAPFAPRTAAAFQADGKLVVAVNLPDGAPAGTLRVEVVEKDKVVSHAERKIEAGASAQRFELAADKGKALSWMEMATDSVYGPQWTHPHPSFSPDETMAAFASDRTGHTQVYVAEIPEALRR